MPQLIEVTSPHRFKERFVFWGEGGGGKSSAILSMARHMPYAHFWVNDTDVSFSYDRLLATEFQDVDERDQVTIYQTSDWDEFTAANADIKEKADQTNDVLVVDNGTFPWQWVQDHHTTVMYGMSADEYMVKLKKQFPIERDYFAALSDGMQWPLINKKYHAGFYKLYHSWKGHAAIVCMSKSIKGEKDEENIKQFGWLGSMPAGQKDIPYVMATNVLFQAGSKNTWTYTTSKDRGRGKVTKIPLTDFAIDYLVDVAEWEQERVRV